MKKRWKELLLVVLAALLSFVVCYFELFYYVDRAAMDRLYQRQTPTDPRIKIIKIDEETLEALGPFGTWDRSVYAKLVEKLGGVAELIVFDVTFSGNMSKEGDEAFAEACRESGNVIVANSIQTSRKVIADENGEGAYLDSMYVENVEEPYEMLQNVTTQGFANAVLDKDGYIRHSLKDISYEGKTYPSLAYHVYKEYAKRQGLSVVSPKTEANGRFGFTYSGKDGAYEEVSLIQVLDGRADVRLMKDCIVLVGAHADGMQDAYAVPVSRNENMYGVDIHANLLEALLEGKTYVAADRLLSALGSAFAAALYLVLARRGKMKSATGVLLLGTAICIGAGILLYRNQIETSVLTLPFLLFVIYIALVLSRYVRETLHKKQVIETFKKYVSPEVVDEIMRQGEFEIQLGGTTKDIAVLFVDIRGFTPLSEKLSPQEVVEILNQYLEHTSSCVFRYRGTVDKFIGDATMAVFNSPFDLEDYEYRAVCAAWEIAQGTEKIGKMTMERFGMEVGFGVGVNCGSAVVGNIGSMNRMDFTAIGDTVNTAARLESQAKSGQILISENLKERLEGRISVREVGEIPLKGKSLKMMVYEVTGIC